MKPSGIGGQAVIEGIMMRNKDQYSIAVRKPDNEIEVTVRDCNQLQKKHPWLNYPIIRGVYSFVDSLVTGISIIRLRFMMIRQSRRVQKPMKSEGLFLKIN